MTAPAGFRGDGGGRDGIGQGELFEPPPFSPTYPNPSSLEGRALSMLLAALEIEHSDFESATGSWRLGAYIETLRDKGWPIETVGIFRPLLDRPERTIARYRLPAWVLREVGAAHG
jgi:hypothetical protein